MEYTGGVMLWSFSLFPVFLMEIGLVFLLFLALTTYLGSLIILRLLYISMDGCWVVFVYPIGRAANGVWWEYRLDVSSTERVYRSIFVLL